MGNKMDYPELGDAVNPETKKERRSPPEPIMREPVRTMPDAEKKRPTFTNTFKKLQGNIDTKLTQEDEE